MDTHVYAGRLFKSFGKEGFLKCELEESLHDSIASAGYLLVAKDGETIPFFIQKMDATEGNIQFFEASSPEKAREISNSELYLLEKHIGTIKQNVAKKPSPVFVGYVLCDQNSVKIGVILDVIVLPMQIFASLEYNDKEVLIPLHEDLIIDIDPSKKEVMVEIAEGLLDL